MDTPSGIRRATIALALGLATATAAGACAVAPSPTGPVSPQVAPDPAGQVLEAYGLAPVAPPETRQVTIGDPAQPPWAQYLEVSRPLGLDFAPLAGQPATLRVTKVRARTKEVTAYVLVAADGRVVGAWLDPGDTSSGVLRIDARP